jgi:hypothetical protein
MWEPRRLTNLWAFTASYKDSFTFFFCIVTCGSESVRSLIRVIDIAGVAKLTEDIAGVAKLTECGSCE